MRRNPCGFDFDPGKSFVSDAKLKLARLGHDRAIGAVVADDRIRADAREFFIGHGGDQHIPVRRIGNEPGGCQHNCRQTAFHIERATSIESVSFNAWIERRGHSGIANRVHMGVEHQRPPTGPTAHAPDHIRTAGRSFLHGHLDSGTLKPGSNEACDLPFPCPTGDKIGIDRVNTY